MKGYKTQYADYNLILDTSGHKVNLDAILADHENMDDIAELIGHKYRPENLHNNGDIDDSYNETGLNLARVTHECRTVNRADLCEQASYKAGQWECLSNTYQQYVAKTQRWIHGYNPEAIKPDAKFMQRVNDTKLRMSKNRSLKATMRKRAHDLGII